MGMRLGMMKMKDIASKKALGMILSRLKGFDNPKVKLEQYETDSETASEIIWKAYMAGEIEGKKVADLGCGTGILGIGALIMGADIVFFVDKDKDALEGLKQNLELVEKDMAIETGEKRILRMDVSEFKPNVKIDTVIMNPPFGTKEEHADRAFLEKAKDIGKVIYSLHKTSTREFVYAYCKDNNLNVAEEVRYNYPLKKSMKFHTKKMERIEVSCFKIVSS